MKSTALLLISLMISACANTRLGFSRMPAPAQPEVHEYKIHGFLGGSIGKGPRYTSRNPCEPDRIASLELRMKPVDVLVTIVTVGIYTPHRLTIRCAQKLDSTSGSKP